METVVAIIGLVVALLLVAGVLLVNLLWQHKERIAVLNSQELATKLQIALQERQVNVQEKQIEAQNRMYQEPPRAVPLPGDDLV